MNVVQSLASSKVKVNIYIETGEKETQDTWCRRSGGVPQFKKVPPGLGDMGG